MAERPAAGRALHTAKARDREISSGERPNALQPPRAFPPTMLTIEDITYVPSPEPEWMQEWERNRPEEVDREYAKWLEAMSAELAPMDDLPPELDATHDKELQSVHFGFIVSERRLL
ncbi:hypothetical protein FA95DRAFT_1612040, partial [Auriscalpium vulgare]